MVVRLWGTANGNPVEFVHQAGDIWVGTVPNTGAGTWVISLWAQDEAGNVGFFATIELLYSAKDLRWEVKVLELGAGVAEEDVRAVFGIAGPLDRLEPEEVHSRAETTEIREEALA